MARLNIFSNIILLGLLHILIVASSPLRQCDENENCIVKDEDPETSSEEDEVKLTEREIQDLMWDDIREDQSEIQFRNAISNLPAKWPEGVIPYEISKDFSKKAKKLIREAMQAIEKVTCIKFRKRRDTDKNYYCNILMPSEEGCYVEKVGRVENATLNLSKYCVTSETLQHELVHVIGFFHEHSRPERDEFVEIMEDNIRENELHNFVKRKFDATTLDLPYDYLSIMHYDGFAFAKDGNKPTMITKDPEYSDKIGRAPALSKLDIKKINALYNCPSKKDDNDMLL